MKNRAIATHPKGFFAKPLKTPEKRPAAGISGCCEHRVGATATHPVFSCLILDPPTQGRAWANTEVNISLPTAHTSAFGCHRVLSALWVETPTQGDNGLHRGYIFRAGGASSWDSSSPYTSSSLPSREDSKISFRVSHRRSLFLSARYTALETSLRL